MNIQKQLLPSTLQLLNPVIPLRQRPKVTYLRNSYILIEKVYLCLVQLWFSHPTNFWNHLGTTAKPTTRKKRGMSTTSKSSYKQEGKVMATAMAAALLVAFAWDRNIAEELFQFTNHFRFLWKLSFCSVCSFFTLWLCWLISFLY